MAELAAALEAAIGAARAAGDLLRAELHRPGGPRGAGGHADADLEADRLIRDRLLAACPGAGYIGEELWKHGDRPRATPGALTWIVDPNDGTDTFTRGARGSAVSIGAVRDGVPVLGVVFAFAWPDDEGRVFAWAEGCGPLALDGRPLDADGGLPARRLDDPGAVVIVSAGAHRRLAANLACVEPARVRPLPSIALRLALAAAGEAVAGVSVHGTSAWDLAGGHALLRARGYVLLDERGLEVRYPADEAVRVGRCFGGAPAAASALVTRPWSRVFDDAAAERHLPKLERPPKGRLIADPGRLSRAQGALLGQLAGDALGSLVEFQDRAAIARRYPRGVRDLADGGAWNTIAGQPTDDSELALALARSIAARGGYDPADALAGYADWLASSPFDVGHTTRTALGAALRAGDDASGESRLAAVAEHASRSSQANGSLMRISPLGVALAGQAAPAIAAAARADSALTHPHPVCADACAAYAVAVAHAVEHGDGARAAYEAALGWARGAGAEAAVIESLDAADREPPAGFSGAHLGWVRIALQNAFYRLLHAPSVEEGVVATVSEGGDTDTNGAIAGALLGAVHGREAVPLRWRSAVLTCRAREGTPRPRPPRYWPVDALELAERLLVAGAPLAPRR